MRPHIWSNYSFRFEDACVCVCGGGGEGGCSTLRLATGALCLPPLGFTTASPSVDEAPSACRLIDIAAITEGQATAPKIQSHSGVGT